MLRLNARLRLAFWVWFLFLLAQSLLLVFFCRRAIKRADSVSVFTESRLAEFSSTLTNISSRVLAVVDWVHSYEGTTQERADMDASGSAAVASPRVLGAGQNGKYAYVDVELYDKEEPYTERRYFPLPPSLKTK